jgi:hypothetical protein
MIEEGDERLLYLGLGPLAAMLLGAALVPVREVTVASNFAFVFMALTIVVAELGGRGAAVATALASALSLDFFLTRPYLRLTIEGKHDVIAFVGLAVCGLIAASLGSERGRRRAELRETRSQLELLQAAARRLEEGLPAGSRLDGILDAARSVLPVAALAVRDGRGRTVAAAGTQAVLVPSRVLQPDSLEPRGVSPLGSRRGGLPLPAEGARLALTIDNHEMGWLDLWGDGTIADARARRTLSAMASVVAAMLPESRR